VNDGLPAFLHPFARPAAPDDAYLTIVRGEGAAVFDRDGRRYIDGLASLWYCQVGHGRAEIAEAVADQLRTLEAYHAFDIFTNEPADRFCRRVAELAPVPDARVFLVSSGSEAVDSALKLARLTSSLRGEPDRQLVVSREHAYHGVTYGGLSVLGLPAMQAGFGALVPGVHNVAHDEIAAMEAAFAEHGPRIAAVIAEPVIGAGGVRPAPEGYFPALRELCDRHGALLIVDEVICGFGRLGRWWGSERYGVQPDLVTFAKGCTSGYQPLGGVVVGSAVREVLEADPDYLLRHGHTYSGHPASCTAGLVNIELIEREELAVGAERIAAALEGPLRGLVEAGLGAEVRGTAGLWALDVPPGVAPPAVRDALLRRGVIARPLGTSTIAFCPPLVIGDDDLAAIPAALADALDEVTATA
jgi:putrescine---pyruvate transaminase